MSRPGARRRWRPDPIILAPGIRHRELILALAARHRLPAVYPFRLCTRQAVLCPTALNTSMHSAARRATSRPHPQRRKRLPIFRCNNRPSSSSAINLKTAKALASRCHRCSRARRRGDRVGRQFRCIRPSRRVPMLSLNVGLREDSGQADEGCLRQQPRRHDPSGHWRTPWAWVACQLSRDCLELLTR